MGVPGKVVFWWSCFGGRFPAEKSFFKVVVVDVFKDGGHGGRPNLLVVGVVDTMVDHLFGSSRIFGLVVESVVMQSSAEIVGRLDSWPIGCGGQG